MSSFRRMCLAAVVFAGCMGAPSAQKTQATSTLPTLRERPGSIESVESIGEVADDDAEGRADEAVVGFLVGGLLLGNLLFHHGTGSVVGIADNSSWPNTTPDGVSSTVPRYRVLVRFDDGRSMTLDYSGDVPFGRGDRVVLTGHGLVRTCEQCDT